MKIDQIKSFSIKCVAVLYDFPSEKKVTFFVNEIPILVKKYRCTLCPWESIKSMFDSIFSNSSCTFDDQTSLASII